MKNPTARAVHALAERSDIRIVSAVPGWLSLQSSCHPSVVEPLLHSFQILEANLPKPVRDKVIVAIREVLQNAIEHGGHFDPAAIVEIDHICTPTLLMLRLRDPGEGFSLKSLRHAALDNPTSKPMHHNEYREQLGIRPGGYGLLIVKQTMDEVLYNEKGNEVILIKYWSRRNQKA